MSLSPVPSPESRSSYSRKGPATRVVRIPGPFHLERGGELPLVELAYESWGTLSPTRDNVILLFTGLSPSAHAASSESDPSSGWWEFMVGPGKPVDTDRYFVVCVNNLGGCYGSTGPASINPDSGKPYALSFPELCIEDLARSTHAMLQVLGIRNIDTVIGASLGGMTALAYAMLYPDEVSRLASLCSAARATPHTIAIRSLQREIIRSDPGWMNGDYAPGIGPVQGMRLARKLGVTSYRSAQEWQERFARERIPGSNRPDTPFAIEFEIESYLEYQAKRFVGSFDANSYLYLSRAMDWFDVAEHGGSIDAGLSLIKAKHVLVVGVETDSLFPIYQQEELANTLRENGTDVQYASLPSLQGHDAFLVDAARFGPLVRSFLDLG